MIKFNNNNNNSAQITNLGLQPYTEKLKEARAKAVIKAFPKYDGTST